MKHYWNRKWLNDLIISKQCFRQMKFTGLLPDAKENSHNLMLEIPKSRSDSTTHQSDAIFFVMNEIVILNIYTRKNWKIWTNIKLSTLSDNIDKKYYFIAYISKILFFRSTLFLFRKFTIRLYSASLTEKYFDCWNTKRYYNLLGSN